MTYAYFFSPTGGTRTIVKSIASSYDSETVFIDFTESEMREQPPVFDAKDILFVGVPVYAGRVPNILLKYLSQFTGAGARAVVIVSYGNRDFDDALLELSDLMTHAGFSVIAAGAFVSAHAFSRKLAAGRPNSKDLQIANAFGKAIQSAPSLRPVIPGNAPYRDYYRPLNAEGKPYDFKRIRPVSLETCIECGKCQTLCPVPGICIKCQACVKNCPTSARQFIDPDFIHHLEELETLYGFQEKENHIYIG